MKNDDEDDTKKSVKQNYVSLEKRTMETYVSVSITSYNETTNKIFDRATKQFKEMMK